MGNEAVIWNSILVLGGIGLACGTMLLVASRFFAVTIDERVEKLIQLLPGANCGACGFAGCAQYAKKLIEGHAASNACRVLDAEKAISLSSLLGVEAGIPDRKKALLRCQGGAGVVRGAAEWNGLKSCRAASLFFQGNKECAYACLGFGDCLAVCPFQAISRKEDGLISIDAEKCTGCGLCVEECPKGLIFLVPEKFHVAVACCSKDRGKRVSQICKKGCIACRRCEKACPVNAIVVEENLAHIRYEICTDCGLCAEACPTQSIIRR